MTIPNQLRQKCGHDSHSVDGCIHCEAADEIEALRAELAEAKLRIKELEK